jgi:hypothetical protein
MSALQTPSSELPGLRKLSPKKQSHRAQSFACLSSEGKLSCEKVIWVGMFFDGTNNNKFRDLSDYSYSNIAVLFNAFRASATSGYFRHYIPGLGTAFPEIGEMSESDDGKSQAVGGDARIHFALIQMYNSVHQALFDKPLVLPDEVKTAVTSVEKGVKTLWLLGQTKRITYFKKLEDRLVAAVREKRPTVKLINLSVFGFSRGAAESRTFSNWLFECCRRDGDAYTFCGIPIRFQFLGIFDTVASVGLADSSPVGNGLSDWADGTMGIPHVVERCVHFVAAHEIRRSFPLSTAREGSAYPANCTEVVYPGAHCDVGGGYSPGDQGKAVAGRSHLASQVPLVNMYLEARKTGVPMLTMQELERGRNLDAIRDFQISDELALRFQAYSKWSRVGVGSVEKVFLEHMRLYWRWRLRVGAKFKELSSYQNSNAQDKEDLSASEGDFLNDMRWIEHIRENEGPVLPHHAAAEKENNEGLVVPADVWRFFDEHVHDSHASFRLLGPITADDRKVAIGKMKAKRAAGKKLNNFEVRALASDAAAPGSFPVMSDADLVDLHDMAGFTTSTAIKTITDTRRESGGHIRNRRVFDRS